MASLWPSWKSFQTPFQRAWRIRQKMTQAATAAAASLQRNQQPKTFCEKILLLYARQPLIVSHCKDTVQIAVHVNYFLNCRRRAILLRSAICERREERGTLAKKGNTTHGTTCIYNISIYKLATVIYACIDIPITVLFMPITALWSELGLLIWQRWILHVI